MSFKIVSAILGGRWLLEKAWADAHLPVVAKLLLGEKVDWGTKAYHDNSDDEDRPAPKPFTCVHINDAGVITASRYSSFNDAPEGSAAIIPIIGPITKYMGDCGEPGSTHMTGWVQQAIASDRIKAIILNIDSPGGMVDGTATLADAIKGSSKPTVAFINDGMMASAAMWIGSAANNIYASQKTDSAGSIGVYTTIADFKGYFEQKGIKVMDIYAPQSKDKNKPYKDALEGNTSLIEDDLKFIADQFIKTVKTNRKGKLNLEFDNPFTGKMYTAEDAISVGLIDGIKSFEDVVSGVLNPSSKTGNANKNSSDMKFNLKSTFKALGSFFGISALTADTEVEMTEEKQNELNEKLTRLTAAEAEIVTLKGDLKTAKDRVTELENIPPGGPSTTVKKDKDDDLNADKTPQQKLEENSITKFAKSALE